jgi:hypothetical protein
MPDDPPTTQPAPQARVRSIEEVDAEIAAARDALKALKAEVAAAMTNAGPAEKALLGLTFDVAIELAQTDLDLNDETTATHRWRATACAIAETHDDLLAELKRLRDRFHAACLASGSDRWAADGACAVTDALIAKAEAAP